MKLYELLVGIRTRSKGLIWCTDGSFMDPIKFRNSGKEAYGYTLDDNTAVRLTRSPGMAWSYKTSPWYNANFLGAQSTTDGVTNSEYLKARNGYGPDNCPAVYYSCTQVNAGVTSYMPSIEELVTLHNSIMLGI